MGDVIGHVTIRFPEGHFLYDTIGEFNVDSTKTNKYQWPLSSVQVREGSPEGTRKTMDERICELSFKSGVKGRGSDRW